MDGDAFQLPICYNRGSVRAVSYTHLDVYKRQVLGETHSNLIFDVSVPFECKKADDEITQAIYSAVSRMEGKCYAVVTIDHAYISETKGKTKMN